MTALFPTLFAATLAAISNAAFAQDSLKVAVGARGNWETAAAELGQNAGYFARHNLKLDILYTQGSGETQQAVISGGVGIGVGLGTTSVMAAFARGAPLRIIGNVSTGSSEYWYVPAASPIKTMRDAVGKTIAYSTNGASSHLEVLAFLKYYGIDARPVATGGTAATFTQVMSHQIDVGWASPPFGLDAAAAGTIRIIAHGNELPYFRDQTIRVLTANTPFFERNRDAVARFITAYGETLAWMYSNPAALTAYAGLAHTSEALAKQVRDEFYPQDGLRIDRISGLDAIMADGVVYKYLSAPLSKGQLAELIQVPR